MNAESLAHEVRPAASATPLSFDALPPVPEGSSLAAEWWLARRHLTSQRNERFLSLVTTISIVGVMVGVAILDAVLAVMTGFEIDLRDKILGANAHIVVLSTAGSVETPDAVAEKVRRIDGVLAAAPFVYTEMMIRSPWAATGIIMKGVDPEHTGDVTSIRDDLELGPSGALETDDARRTVMRSLAEPVPPRAGVSEENPALPGILIGRELMETLQVAPGDAVQVINPLGGGPGPLGMPAPSVTSFRVAGMFYSGMYEYDTKWTYVSNGDAAALMKLGERVTGVEVRVSDIDAVEQISTEMEAVLGPPLYTRHWRNLNQTLFEALALEKVVMSLILGMVVVVAGLLIVSNLYMMVLTKRREIAILKAMGAGSRSVLRVFVFIGCVIGGIGTTLGTALGLLICQALDTYQFPLETDVYYLSSLPVVIVPANIAFTAVAAFAVCVVSTLYPARLAAALDPVEGLRYE